MRHAPLCGSDPPHVRNSPELLSRPPNTLCPYNPPVTQPLPSLASASDPSPPPSKPDTRAPLLRHSARNLISQPLNHRFSRFPSPLNLSQPDAPTPTALSSKSATPAGRHPCPSGAPCPPSQSTAPSDEYQWIGRAHKPCSGLAWGSLGPPSRPRVRARQGQQRASIAIRTIPPTGAPTPSARIHPRIAGKTCAHPRPRSRRSHEPTHQ
jgi:hypothetical protein